MAQISADTIQFLSDLKENNSREWFNDNRKKYDLAKENFIGFTNELIAAIASIDDTIGTLEAKDCIFRIFRDVRFSPNKAPYKTNMGAYIARGGRKSPYAGYYFHIEPNNSFISGGIYMAPPNIMTSIRKDIETYPDTFIGIVEDESFKKTFVNLGGESLKRVPTGFSAQSPVAEYLKLKHITPHCPMSDSELLSPNVFSRIVDVYMQMKPLVGLLNASIEQEILG